MHHRSHFATTPSPCDWHPRARVVFGPGSVGKVGTLAAEIGARHALIVTDKGIVAAGHAERVRAALAAAGVAVTLFDDVHENPTTSDVRRCMEVAAPAKLDLFIGLGGGSSIDT